MNAEIEWPVRLVLRDTKIHADEGQRIYTTATATGYGYEKLAYVRADVCDEMLAALKTAVALSDKTVSPLGRTAACQRVYDQCAAAISKAVQS